MEYAQLAPGVLHLMLTEKRLALTSNRNVSFGRQPPESVTVFYLDDC